MEKQDIHYPWHLAPDWAQYAYINVEGEARWISGKPYLIYIKIKDWTPPPSIDLKIPFSTLQKRPDEIHNKTSEVG